MVDSDCLLKYIASPYNIYISQIYNSFESIKRIKEKCIDDKNTLSRHIIQLVDILDIFSKRKRDDLKMKLQTLNMNDNLMNSLIFKEFIESFLNELENFIYRQQNILEKDILNLCGGFKNFFNIFSLKSEVKFTNEIYEEHLENLENLLDSIHIYKSEENIDLKQHISDIFFGFYGIIESLNLIITDIKWTEIIINKEKLIVCI